MSRYDELNYRLDRLVESLPNLSSKVLGTVVYKDKPYEVLRLKVNKRSRKNKIKVCMAFCTHGNEDLTFQSTVEFLKSLLDPNYKHPFFDLPSKKQRKEIVSEFSITIYFFNPIGFDLNTRTNGRRQDQNRWFGKKNAPREVQLVTRDINKHKFDVCIDLHGDKSAKQFMIYERTRLERSIAEQIIKVEKKQKVAVVKDGDHGGELVKNGVISSPSFANTFDDYLFFERKAKVALVFEYAGKDDVVDDIKSILIAIYAALKIMKKEVSR